MSDKIDYTAVIAALEAEKAQTAAEFDVAIAAIRQVAARPPSGAQQMPLAVGGPDEPSQPSASPYTGQSVTAAAASFLRAIGKPRSTADIAQGLERGGFRHGSKNFGNTVYSRLYRDKKRFVRQRDKWALKEWSQKETT